MPGIPRSRIITRIKIPQMLTLIIPPVTNQIILLLKESAVFSSRAGCSATKWFRASSYASANA